MEHASLEMSSSARSKSDTPNARLDEALGVLKERARRFARMPPLERAALLRATLPRIVDAAPDWALAGARPKGLSPDRPAAGEEWLGGPMTTVRNARLLAEGIERIAVAGKPTELRIKEARDGAL